jgi:hypothetical protein
MLFGKHLVGEARWRWLLGELLVVIIGVLAALSIEKAWSDRLDRELEFDYLTAIRTAVQADIDFVDNFQQGLLKRKMDAIKAIGPTVRGLAPIPDNLELFLTNVGFAAIGGVAPNYVVRRVTFDDLVSTGNLRLIRDPRIRREIASYYSSYDTQHRRTVARLTGFSEFNHGILPFELRGEMNLLAMQSFNVDRAIEAILSNEFESLLNREQNLGFFMGTMNVQFLSRARTFLHELDKHIERLDQS